MKKEKDKKEKNNSTELKELDKRKITLYSLLVSIFLVIIKIAVAYYTNSIGVLSEALNNSLDIVTVVITFMAVRISTRPADKDHTYGHGKYENLSSFIEIIIISLLCFFIIYKSVQRIILKDFVLNINPYVFAVLVISVIINIVRVYYIRKVAIKYNSFALKAEFLNYLGDIFSSIIVLSGLLLAETGFQIADPIASIIVSVIVLIFSLRLMVEVVKNLMDYIPAEITEKVLNVLKEFPEIKSVDELKIHEVGNIKFINLKICLEDMIYSPRVEGIKDSIKNKILESVPDAEIILETKYQLSKNDTEKYIKEIVLSQPYVKDIHDVFIYNVDSGIDISIHVELNKYLKLDEAEKLTKIIEEKIKEKIKNTRSVYIHIEDVRDSETWNDITKKSEQFISDIKKEVSLYIDPETCHNFTVLEREGVRNIAFHCRLQKNLDIAQAHSIITRLENDIKRKFKNINEVVIHVEPE